MYDGSLISHKANAFKQKFYRKYYICVQKIISELKLKRRVRWTINTQNVSLKWNVTWDEIVK